ncbi:hypothetical protein SOASR015_09170 [Pectobacterium carotovorum subsp. carotovorum]|nr:hypothetical protein SOASR015_09170 [Pectobacterium carotovorum subsp. carotovorum]GLX56191.1 hypothetical protein Pcaca02_15000 [Pectobacterium carotovorum subsp. carotovorum]
MSEVKHNLCLFSVQPYNKQGCGLIRASDLDLSSDTVGLEKMEYADPELAVGDEPFYYQVR